MLVNVKRWLIALFTTLVFVSIYPSNSTNCVSAAPSKVEEKEVIRNQEEENQEALNFIEALDRLEATDRYQVTVRWIDLVDQSTIGEVNVIGQQSSGDFLAQFKFYPSNYVPQITEFNLLSYQRYDLVYVQLFKLLDSLAFYKQPFFDYHFDKLIKKYKDDYVQVDQQEFKTGNLAQKPVTPFIIQPNKDKLNKVAKDYLEKNPLNGKYDLKIDRIEIPGNFFEGQKQFGLDYQMFVNLQEASTKDRNYHQWQNEFQQQVRLSEEESVFSVQFQVKSTISDQLLKGHPERERWMNDFEQSSLLSGRGIMDKVTKVHMTLDPDKQTYQLVVEGMMESLDFNLFKEDTAELSTKHIRMEYQFSPTDIEVPDLDSIHTMSIDEANYLIEQLLDK